MTRAALVLAALLLSAAPGRADEWNWRNALAVHGGGKLADLASTEAAILGPGPFHEGQRWGQTFRGRVGVTLLATAVLMAGDYAMHRAGRVPLVTYRCLSITMHADTVRVNIQAGF